MSNDQIQVKLVLENSQYTKQLGHSIKVMQDFGTKVSRVSTQFSKFNTFFVNAQAANGAKALERALVKLKNISLATAESYISQEQHFSALLDRIEEGHALFQQLANTSLVIPGIDEVESHIQNLLPDVDKVLDSFSQFAHINLNIPSMDDIQGALQNLLPDVDKVLDSFSQFAHINLNIPSAGDIADTLLDTIPIAQSFLDTFQQFSNLDLDSLLEGGLLGGINADSLAEKAGMYAQFGQDIFELGASIFNDLGALQDEKDQREIDMLQHKIDNINTQKQEELNALTSSADYEKMTAEQRASAKKEIEEKYNAEMMKVEEQKAKKEDELKRRQFEQAKATKIADIIISAAMGAVNIWSQAGINFPLAIAMTSLLAGITAANIGKIASQQYPGLYEGGIIPAQGELGGLYRLGDKNTTEVVMPLDKLGDFIDFNLMKTGSTVVNNYSITVNGFVGNERELAIQIDELLTRGRREGYAS